MSKWRIILAPGLTVYADAIAASDFQLRQKRNQINISKKSFASKKLRLTSSRLETIWPTKGDRGRAKVAISYRKTGSPNPLHDSN